MRVDEARSLSIFDGLTDDQLAELVEGGTEVRIEPGVDLFREGEHADYLRSAADRASWDTSGLKMQVRGLRPVTRAANA